MQPLRRIDGWDVRLIDALAAEMDGPFAWGTRDCATLFAAAVAAVTGDDPLAAFRPWGSERTARRRLAAAGVTSVLEFCERAFVEIVPADARRGDVGFTADTGPLVCPVVVTGEHAVGRAADGLVRVDRRLLVRTFMVGV